MTARHALLFLLGAAAFAQSAQPAHWSIGWGAGIPTAYAMGGGLCSNVNVEYSRELDAQWGYTLGLGAAARDRNPSAIGSWVDPETERWGPMPAGVRSGFVYASFGGFYAVSKNSFDLYANARCGPYLAERYTTRYATEEQSQYTVGLEAGLRKRIISGIWLNASYSYAPLDKDKVWAGSMQWAGLGLNCVWGRK